MDTTNTNNGKEAKRPQFTTKQRLDLYAFCVLEIEINSNKVSIKKQQRAIQRVLSGNKQRNNTILESASTKSTNDLSNSSQIANDNNTINNPATNVIQPTEEQASAPHLHNLGQLPPQTNLINYNNSSLTEDGNRTNLTTGNNNHNNSCSGSSSGDETSKDLGEKTLVELQQEVAMRQTCYSDFQRTQVLTSSMLREVQRRFAKYYPDAPIPSRTTIKHVFDKCVEHGTVENMKKPKKTLKIPHGDEIEQMLIKEPQLSLRQLAQKLNVSTGTISRRCKDLGIVPESVTLKHQQMATARRQRRIKRMEKLANTSTTTNMDNTTTSAMDQTEELNDHQRKRAK